MSTSLILISKPSISITNKYQYFKNKLVRIFVRIFFSMHLLVVNDLFYYSLSVQKFMIFLFELPGPFDKE